MLRIALLLALFVHEGRGETIPVIHDRVTDLTQTLSRAEAGALTEKLAAFERETSNQLVVLIVPTTGDEDIFSFTQEVGERNAIGQKGKNNGVVLCVAKDDRKINIHVGYGLEGALPDAIADQIIRHIILPSFRDGDYAGGIDRGVDAIIAATKGEFKGDGDGDGRSGRRIPVGVIALLIFFVSLIMRIVGGSRRHYLGRGGVVSRGGWWWGGMGGFGGGGFGGGGFGGGGFGGGGFSGGGGSFGGGGASGSW